MGGWADGGRKVSGCPIIIITIKCYPGLKCYCCACGQGLPVCAKPQPAWLNSLL